MLPSKFLTVFEKVLFGFKFLERFDVFATQVRVPHVLVTSYQKKNPDKPQRRQEMYLDKIGLILIMFIEYTIFSIFLFVNNTHIIYKYNLKLI